MPEQEQWNTLDPEQRARGQALIIARDILSQKGGGPFSSVSLANASVFDVITVAQWVLDGKNPLEGEVVDLDGDAADEDEDREERRAGDAVRVTFDDRSSRLFIDTGRFYFAPTVWGRFHDSMNLAYDDKSISHVDVIFHEAGVAG